MSRTCAPSVSLPDALHAAYLAAGGPPLATVVAAHEEAWLRANGHAVPPRPAEGRTAAASRVANERNREAAKEKIGGGETSA